VIGSFEHRGYSSGYYEGQILREFNNYDNAAGMNVAEDIGVQLDAMRQLGINTIWFTLSAADARPGNFSPPNCTVNPDLGPQFPQPAATELANLKPLFDLIHSKGIQVVLNLSNTHMEDQKNSAFWLKSILDVVKDHPALYLVLFSGDIHLHHSTTGAYADFCGGRAEPPLFEGPGSESVKYLKWAIPFAHDLGIPYRKLTAEAMLGFYYSVAQAPNQFMTDGHYWDPAVVLKGIFDDLGIPTEERTYAISFYEHHKCAWLEGIDIPCEDEPAQAWAIETMDRLFVVIGRNNGARVVAVEAGLASTSETGWNSELAWESLIWLYQAYGIEGCMFWLWTNYQNVLDLDPKWTPAIKRRGLDFTYNSVKDILEPLFTQGQTNDLKLTPDTIPPVFSSINATPAFVKNGDQLEITARLGETHLFVWVDLTSLDSARSSQVVLIDQGDGTYAREITLSAWDVNSNGVKNLKVTAMDFWSNVASTSVNISLQNPAPILDNLPPNDQFTGTTLDHNKWQDKSTNGGTIAQNDRLILTTSGTQATSFAGVQSTWGFTGDFDVQVEFQIGDGWSIPATGHIDGATFGVQIAGQLYHVTRLRRDNGDNIVFAWSSTVNLGGEATASAIIGRYRLIRKGTVLTLLFDIGNGWVEIAHTTVPSSNANVYLENTSHDVSHAFTAYFFNFQINSGLTTYRP